jgi:glycine cleavage system H protein
LIRKFNDLHQWVELNEPDSIATVGITNHGQELLGDVVFVELPSVGKRIAAQQVAVIIESVKVANEVHCAINGEVVEINDALIQYPDLINTSPESDGWLFKMKITNADDINKMMDEKAYNELISSQTL